MNHTAQSLYQTESRRAVRRMLALTVWVSAVCYGLYALVLAPVYTQLSANVLYQDAWFTAALSYLLSAMDIVVFLVVYPATVYAVWRGGLKGAYSVPLAFVLLTLGKYVLNFFMTCLTDGGFPSGEIFLEQDLPIIAPSYLLEVLQYALVLLIAVLIRRSRMARYNEELLYEKKTADVRSLAFPMTKLFSYRNPLQWTALWMAVVMLVGRLLMHGMYQFTLLIYNGATDGALVIAIDLVSDVILGAVAYFLAILLMSHFDKKEMEALAAQD